MTYQRAGITADARSWTRPAPTLRDLRDTLTAASETGDVAARELTARLHPFVEGAFKQLFDGRTTTTPDGHLVVFSLRTCPRNSKPSAPCSRSTRCGDGCPTPRSADPDWSSSTRRGC